VAVDRRNAHVLRRDAYYDPAHFIYADDLAEHAARAVVPRLPETVAEDHHGRGAGAGVFRREGAAECGANLEQRRKAGRDSRAANAVLRRVGVEVIHTLADRREVLERVQARLPLCERVRADAEWNVRVGRVADVDLDDAVAVGIGQRRDEEMMNDREYGYIGADAECEREHDDGGEGGRAAEAAPGVANVLQRGIEAGREPDAARFFAHLGLVTQLAARRGARCIGRKSALLEVARQLVAVERELVAEGSLFAAEANPVSQAP